jgi:hypothetical protein
MSSIVPTAFPVVADRDGMAVLGRTRHALMGIRYVDGEGGAGAGAADAGAAGAADAGAAGAGGAGAGTDAGAVGTGTEAQDVASLPAWAQKVITDTRAEAARYRTGTETAAQQAQQQLADKIAQAIGLKPDESTDPAALTAKLTQAQEATKATERRLAVFSAAADTQQATALLNRLDFTNSIAGIDPSDATAIAAAVQAAVDADPSLKTARAAGASTVSGTAGSGEGQPITEEQLAQMTAEQISDAYDKGLLKHLL